MDREFSVQPWLSDLEMIRLTAEQIKKDFAFFSLPVVFSGNRETAYAELSEQVLPHIRQLVENDYARFLSLMYRVDIPERQLAVPAGAEKYQHFTNLVIKRCLQKVVLRKLYS
jgi:hypothetical protein